MPECHVADNADFPRVVKIFEQGIVLYLYLPPEKQTTT